MHDAILTLSQVVDHETIDGICWVYVETDETTAVNFSKQVYDRWEGTVTLRVTLSELADYPECERCGKPTLDLVHASDTGANVCDDCTPEAQAREAAEYYADCMQAAAEASADWCWR